MTAPPHAVLPLAPPLASPAAEPTEITRIRDHARAVLRAQSLLVWKQWTSGEHVDLAGTQQGADALYSAESLKKLRSHRATLSSDAARALHRLELHVAGEILARETSAEVRALTEAERAATLNVGGNSTPWRDLERMLTTEASSAGRAALLTAERPVLQRLAPLHEARRVRVASVLARLGWATPDAFGAELRDMPRDALALLAEATLAASDSLYFKAMERLSLSELGLPLGKLRRGDLPRLLRPARGVDAGFPAAGAFPAARAVYESLGLSLSSLPGLTLDLDARPRKIARPVTIAVDPPIDVRFSSVPAGGVEEWRAMLHELAHAQQLGRVLGPEWELRQLGPAGVTEMAGFLMESLAANPTWLKSATRLDDAARTELVFRSAARRLYVARRTAAQVLFDLQRSDLSAAEEPAHAWSRLMSRATGVTMTSDDAARHAVEHDPLFSAADYLQAWLLAAQAQRDLERSTGERWWESKSAGNALAAAWEQGGALTPDELARRFRAQRVSPDALVELLGRALER
jgi:hypothetical protein